MSPDDTIYYPPSLNRPLTAKFNLAGSTISPGQTQAGSFPFARFDGGGVWVATLNQIELIERDDVRAFRAVRMMAQGGVMPIAVPRLDSLIPPFPTINSVLVLAYQPVPHSDGSFFSDGSGYAQPAIVAVTTLGAPARASSIDINFISVAAAQVRGGEVFAINHGQQGWRMYEVKTVFATVGSSDVQVTFEPPLRDSVNAGASIEFDLPRCTMRLAKPDSMDLDLSTWPFPRPIIDFIEYFFPSSG